MLGIALLSLTVILFTAYQVNILFDAEKEADQDTTMAIIEEISLEKTISQEMEKEELKFQMKAKKTQRQLLNIRLELLNIKSDLKAIIPELLN